MAKTIKLNGAFMGHQGDTQWFSISELPKGAKKVKKEFIAASEKSGHVHALCGDYEMYTSDQYPTAKFIVVGSDGATLNHTAKATLTPAIMDKNEILKIADHKPMQLAPNTTYIVGIQRVKKHFEDVWENVRD